MRMCCPNSGSGGTTPLQAKDATQRRGFQNLGVVLAPAGPCGCLSWPPDLRGKMPDGPDQVRSGFCCDLRRIRKCGWAPA
jgi:hypothetical protein